MLKKRIIPCLDIKDGRTVKGINFENIIDAGDPIELAKNYVAQGADELVFLDITASIEKRKTMVSLVERISREINIPFTVGGGISILQDVEALIKAGADKVSINSAAVKNPELISDIANSFGKQCVVVAVDTNFVENEWKVFVMGGKVPTSLSTLKWIKEAEQRGAGEILLTSMKNDGTKAGFAMDLMRAVVDIVNIPVIASGGAGKMEHFAEVFGIEKLSGALAASVFHYNQISIPKLKNYLKKQKIQVR